MTTGSSRRLKGGCVCGAKMGSHECVGRAHLKGPRPAKHQPFEDDGATYCGWLAGDGVHDGCGEAWPCATIRALDGGEQG